jgi:23S rRNA pseudouridine2604 synthase
VFLLFNKPAGIATTTDLSVRNNIISALNYPASLLPIGFLDREAEGLMLLSNDTQLARKLTKADTKFEKEYIVTVDRLITPDFLTKVSEGGIPEPGATRKKNFVAREGSSRFRMVLEPGTNHHVKRVVEALGYKVVHLQRVRLGDFIPGKLHVGMWRTLTDVEIASITSIASSKIRSANIPHSGASDDFFGEEVAPPRSSTVRPKSSTGLKSPGRPSNAAKKPAAGKRIGKSAPKPAAGSRGSSRMKPTTGRNAAPRSSGRRSGAPKK